MVEQFLTQAQDQPFKDWLARHPQGFYLNERSTGTIKRGQGGVILHKVGCPHLGAGEGVISTTYAKAASNDREQLIAWAKDKGLTVVACSSCKPEGTSPTASRPYTPGPDYGIPKSEKGLLPWEHVSERMVASKYYWISTVDPDGRPHATPVDGLWLDGQLFFGGSPATRRNRNLVANPAVCIHLESGVDVVILHGEVKALGTPEWALAVRLSDASIQKYGYGPKPEDYAVDMRGTYVFRPRTVFAWKQFPKDVTRWDFP